MSLAYRLIVDEPDLRWFLFAIAIGAIAGIAAVIFFVSLAIDLWPWLADALAPDDPAGDAKDEESEEAARRRLDSTISIVPSSRFRS